MNQDPCEHIILHHAKSALNQFYLTIFQQYNNPKHTEKRVQEYLNEKDGQQNY